MASLLQGFNEIDTTNKPVINNKLKMTYIENALRFNKDVAKTLGYPAYVKILVNERSRKIAVTPCEKGETNSIKFSKPEDKQTTSINVKVPRVLASLSQYFPLEQAEGDDIAYQQVAGEWFQRENVVIFNIDDAKAGTMKHRGRRKATAPAENNEQNNGQQNQW